VCAGEVGTRANFTLALFQGWGVGSEVPLCCIHCGHDEQRILDVVPREDGARNSG